MLQLTPEQEFKLQSLVDAGLYADLPSALDALMEHCSDGPYAVDPNSQAFKESLLEAWKDCREGKGVTFDSQQSFLQHFRSQWMDRARSQQENLS